MFIAKQQELQYTGCKIIDRDMIPLAPLIINHFKQIFKCIKPRLKTLWC